MLVCLLLFISFSNWIFIKIIGKKITVSNLNIPLKIIYLTTLPILMFIGMRGGVQQIPINESAAYFSRFQIHNHIATNPVWFLIKSIERSNNYLHNPYHFMEDENAKKIVNKLYEIKNTPLTPLKEGKSEINNLFQHSTSNIQHSSSSVLKSTHPNIVIIILESYTADIIEALGGEKNVSPNFNNLVKEGLLFTNIYSSGTRTEQGLVAVLSGFPANPNLSIIEYTDKVEKLPVLTNYFIENNYQTSFYYGGETEFSGIKGYLVNSGFEKIISRNDFPKNQQNSKWGAHDEFVFEKQLKDLSLTLSEGEGNQRNSSPSGRSGGVFSVLLSLSNHEPFEVPMDKAFDGDDRVNKFRNSAFYTDKCIGEYFAKAKKEKWYENTLFIMVADHGHHLPKETNANKPAERKIPLLFVGGALSDEWKGKQINKIGNHNDIPTTLLEQLKDEMRNMKYETENQSPITNHQSPIFTWSKNLLGATTNDFAYFTNDTEVGWVTPEQEFIYHTEANKISFFSPQEKSLDTLLLNDAKAYLQVLYKEFLEK